MHVSLLSPSKMSNLGLCNAPSRHLRRQENFDLCLQQIQVISSCDDRLHGKMEVVGSFCRNDAPPMAYIPVSGERNTSILDLFGVLVSQITEPVSS